MIFFPPAKINLGLYVHGKRADGYHEIESCMLAIPFTDILEVIPQDTFEFKQTGLTVDSDVESNLCVRAFRLMQRRFDTPNVYIHLRKQIPMGAGLGGGSADAAYVILAINQLFGLNCSKDVMKDLASQLGSDCPFFISEGAQLAKGRGELLSPLPIDLKGHWLKIINPGIHIGTREAYAGIQFSSDNRLPLEEILSRPIQTWKEILVNDFERSIFHDHPEIQIIKENLYREGAWYASMSGSGSTVFGIFEHKPESISEPPSNWTERIVQFD
jgi:4-diphosphocytidyl-2-C-methyl-D-erythritol kinase